MGVQGDPDSTLKIIKLKDYVAIKNTKLLSQHLMLLSHMIRYDASLVSLTSNFFALSTNWKVY